MSVNIRKPRVVAQVIVFGHHLSPQSKRFLQEKLGPNVRLINYHLHVPDFSKVADYLFEMFEMLETEYELDLTGTTRTIMTAPGSSMVAALLPIVWEAIAGKGPEMFNLILDPAQTGKYIPSPDSPFVDTHAVKRQTRPKLRPRNNGVEMLDVAAQRPTRARA